MTEFQTRPYDCSLCHKVTHVTLVKNGAWLCYSCRKEYNHKLDY